MVAEQVACPNNPAITCPYREHLMLLHSSTVSSESAAYFTEEINPQHDAQLLALKLVEHTVQARARGCNEAADETCSVAFDMAQSPVRRGAKSILNRMINR